MINKDAVQAIQDEQNKLNEEHARLCFEADDECPKCEGHCEVFDDNNKTYKECDRCEGTGQYYD